MIGRNNYLLFFAALIVPLLTIMPGVDRDELYADSASGTVYHDRSGDGQKDPGEEGIEGVRVTNGHEVVRTDEQGHYELPVEGDRVISVVKPEGWKLPVNDLNLPQFYYIHRPDGSPEEKLSYPGIEPTGDLPGSIDFPLYPYETPETIRVLLMADPQVSSRKEITYFGRDTMTDIQRRNVHFGMTLGDVVSGGQLEYFRDMAEMQSLAGVPWYYVIGNHDLNQGATTHKYAAETFRRVFGPVDYAFQYGHVHFLAFNNNHYEGNTYEGGLTDRQLDFLNNYLQTVPESHRIVLNTHIPMGGPYPALFTKHDTPEFNEVLQILSDHPRTSSFSGHTHINSIFQHGEESGYDSPTGSVHRHHNLGAASGGWWRGPLDHRGIPEAPMYDGTPRGYGVGYFSRDGSRYRVEFKPTFRPDSYQLNVSAPDRVTKGELLSGQVGVYVNVFNSSERSDVSFRLGENMEWIPMERTLRTSPYYEFLYNIDRDTPMRGTRRMKDPRLSFSMWYGTIPEGTEMKPGTHLLRVRGTDAYGQPVRGVHPVQVEKTDKQD